MQSSNQPGEQTPRSAEENVCQQMYLKCFTSPEPTIPAEHCHPANVLEKANHMICYISPVK